MKTISLTKGKIALVDDIDYPWLSELRWCSSSDGYATNYYTDEHGQRHRRGMHRMVMVHLLGGPIPRNLTVDTLIGTGTTIATATCVSPHVPRTRPTRAFK